MKVDNARPCYPCVNASLSISRFSVAFLASRFYSNTPEGRRTLWLTLSILDRFLERKNISRKRLQLVGVSAMFIATKFEEIDPPSMRELILLTKNACSEGELLHMEILILRTLDFVLRTPCAGYHSVGAPTEA